MIPREFMRQNPFFRLLLPLLMGIVSTHVFLLPKVTNYIFFLIGIFGISVFVFFAKLQKLYAYRSLFGIFVFITATGAGGLRYLDVESSMQINTDSSVSALYGTLLEKPEEKANSYAVVVRANKLHRKNIWQKADAKIMLYLQKENRVNSLQMGDLLLLNTGVQKVKNLGNPYEFDYAFYLKTQQILYTAYADSLSWKLVDTCSHFSFSVIAANWRNKLLDIYRKNGIKDESFDILAALSLGYKTSLDPETKKAWANAGAMHVLAVSGLHVGIVYLIMKLVLHFLTKLKYGGFLRGLLLLFSLWMYAFLTGLSPSVMRSACMFSFIVVGEMVNRNGSIYNSLAVSAFLLLLIDPFLLFTIGFQFSYLAVLGIVLIQAKLDKILDVKSWILNKIWQLTTVSLAAQIATFPLAIYYFHQFPSYFLISGYLVITMAGILIYLSAILLVVSPIDIFSNFLGYLLHNLVEKMNYLIIQIQNLPGAVLKNLSLDFWEMLLIYGLIISLLCLFLFKQKRAIFIFLSFIICFQISIFYMKFNEDAMELIVFNAQKNSIIGLVNKKKAIFLVDANLPKNKKERILAPYLLGKGIEEVEYEFLKPIEIRLIGGKVVVILGKREEEIDHIVNSLKPDFLVYRKNALKTNRFLSKKDSTCQVIFDASLYTKDREKFLLEMENIDCKPIDIKFSGAYVYQF